MTGRMVSKWPGKCLECEHEWRAGDMIFYNEGRVGYYCSESCARSAVEPVDAQTAAAVQYTPPTADIAVNPMETIPRALIEGVVDGIHERRQRAINEAHMENMAANEALVGALAVLSKNVDAVRVALDKIAKWLLDDAMANRGLKL